MKNLLISLVLIFPWLVSCGGGSTDVAGGIGGTGSSLGAVSAKGSVTVNGVRFNTDQATVVFQGETQPGQGDLSQIEEGMIVAVQGRYDSDSAGVANRVECRSTLIGRITDVNPVNNSFTVMGQVVTIDDDPSIGTRMPGLPNRLADLKEGDPVWVGGSSNNAGVVASSFVRRAATFVSGVGESSISGSVSALDLGTSTFRIGGLTVKFDSNGGTQFKNMVAGDLTASPYAEVKGLNFDGAGALLATSIEKIARGIDLTNQRKLEIQGVVTGCVGLCTSFLLEGQTVNTNSRTVFVNGLVVDLINDRKVEVEGTVDSLGHLLAAKVKFVKGSVEIEALPDGVADTATQTFPILGVSVKVNTNTTKLGSGVTLAGIGTERLRVKGYRIGDRAIIATRVDRAGGAGGTTDVLLRGPLSAADKASSSFAIIGVPVAVDGFTEFRDSSGGSSQLLGFDNFFDTTQTGSIIKAKGQESTADQIDARGNVGGSVELESKP